MIFSGVFLYLESYDASTLNLLKTMIYGLSEAGGSRTFLLVVFPPLSSIKNRISSSPRMPNVRFSHPPQQVGLRAKCFFLFQPKYHDIVGRHGEVNGYSSPTVLMLVNDDIHVLGITRP